MVGEECPDPVVQEDLVAVAAAEEMDPYLPVGSVVVGVHSAWGSEWSSAAGGECWAVRLGLGLRVGLRW